MTATARHRLHRRFVHRSATWAAAALLGACATLRLDPDLSARAPVLDGFGQHAQPISSGSASAQRLFNAGLMQAYAFNEKEALRSFKAALAQDSGCAMCAWGVAWQLGPNINNHDRSGVAEALRYVDHALRSLGSTPSADSTVARERALVEALALRYGHASQARTSAPLTEQICKSKGGDDDDDDRPPHPLNVAYAERMRAISQASPDDADLLSLYAEAEMIATRGDWWKAAPDQATALPAGRIGELADKLERSAAAWPQHTGVNHYLIHAVDAVGVAQRAEAAADRLGKLAPMSPHLLHMPSHTYIWLGRFADAVAVNQQALAADARLDQAQTAQGFSISKDWRGHNGHFLWFAALVSARGDLALELARQAAARALKADHRYGEYRRALPTLTLLRLERWQAVLDEPAPTGRFAVAALLSTQARATALARLGRLDQAEALLVQIDALARTAAAAPAEGKSERRFSDDTAKLARARVRAELALARSQFDAALAQQALAVAASAWLDDNEPPMLAAASRQTLGEMQLRAGRFAAAEASFRADLLARPGSGWALRGLTQALKAQGRDAASPQAEWDRAWALADPALRRNL